MPQVRLNGLKWEKNNEKDLFFTLHTDYFNIFKHILYKLPRCTLKNNGTKNKIP